MALLVLFVGCADGPPAASPQGGGGPALTPEEDADRRHHPNGDEDTDADDATLRRAALAEWYTEVRVDERTTTPVTPFTPEYRRYILEAAAVERARWADLLPDADRDPTTLSGPAWKNIGPTNAQVAQNGGTILHASDSGRIRAIAVDNDDPKRIYIGSAGGGAWRTTDGGASWKPLSETLGSLSVGALAVEPYHGEVVYMGLGDPFDGTGIGLVKSTDGGDHWSAPMYLGDSTVTTQIVVSRLTRKVVLAATNRGLWRSTDAGATWTQVTLATGQAEPPYVWSIAYTGQGSYAVSLEAAPSQTMATTDGQVWVTPDSGATWKRAAGIANAAGVGRITLASSPSKLTVVYAMAAIPHASSAQDLADLFRSTDGGVTWKPLNVTGKSYTNGNLQASSVGALLNGQGWYDQLVFVDPKHYNNVFFGGALLLAHTTDGGKSFAVASDWLGQFGLPYVHADFHASASGSDGAFYLGTDGGIFRSTDGGKSWSDSLNVGLTTHLVYSVGSSSADRTAVIGGFQDNGTRVRSGETSTFNQYVGGDGFGSDIHELNAKQMLGSLYFDRIVKSSNGGTSFAGACSGISECGDQANAPFITRIVKWSGSTTGNDLYTFSNKVVYRSDNYATSWTKLGTTGLPADIFIRNVGAARTDANVLGVVANGGRIFLSKDGGATWTAAAAPPNNNKSLSSIHFDVNDPRTVYVASVAPTAPHNHLWRSPDFGATWAPIDGNGLPSGIPVNQVRGDPRAAQTLYAATELGVYRSLDGGATWARFGAGMPLVNVQDLYLSPDGSLVRAATFGRGFWELVP